MAVQDKRGSDEVSRSVEHLPSCDDLASVLLALNKSLVMCVSGWQVDYFDDCK